MKNLIIIASVILVGGLAFFYFTKSTKDIADLENYFKSSGFTVSNVYLPQKEKEALEAFKGFAEDLGAKNTTIVDSQLRSINNIEVKITQYKNTKVAKEDYEKQVSLKAKSKVRAEQNKTKYNHTDYFLNKNFVLTIHHFDVSLDFITKKVDISKETLDKIVATFRTF